MSVARVVEISTTSTKSFEDAIVQGIDRANAAECEERLGQGAGGRSE